MKIGIMGGTFDPVHLGHLLAAEQALEAHSLDEVWFLPAYLPPHKRKHTVASPGLRLAMLKEAIRGQPRFRVEEAELRRGGVTYTVDSVRELCRTYPQHDFHYMIGSDALASLPGWRGIEEIAARVGFIELKRQGCPGTGRALPEFITDRMRSAGMTPVGLSSADVRARRAAGLSIRYLVPERVLRIIESSGLYRPDGHAEVRNVSISITGGTDS
ncbi:nicotinate-nucleotide adenylyltransferase [Paenibacillus sp. GCM10012303]|uniref:nicotinate-nucleotide adenylyltransferase n=1 Tax=Paenibacillus sp. GCM10012303 TaxID=3317340 RepID=UPI0036243141